MAEDHLLRGRWDVLGVIALGGALGSGARYGVAEALPHQLGELAWGTAVVNLTGSFLLGLLMVFVLELWPPRRYLRPFLGVGLLGGFTTFSTYLVDTHGLLMEGRYAAAAAYLLGTLVLGLAAVLAGLLAGRALTRARPGRRPPPTPDPAPGTRSTR